MTIELVRQDITYITSGIIGHGVNCQGKMNSGVAKLLRNRYPIIYESYIEVYEEYMDNPANLLGFADFVHVHKNLIIANMFTQLYYGNDGRVYASPDAIRFAIKEVINEALEYNMDVYIPKIGCGLGGLDWEATVLPILKYCVPKSLNLFVCEIK